MEQTLRLAFFNATRFQDRARRGIIRKNSGVHIPPLHKHKQIRSQDIRTLQNRPVQTHIHTFQKYSSESAADTAAFTVQDGTDTVPPVLTSWTSDKPADLLPSIKINWSEPVLLRFTHHDRLLRRHSSPVHKQTFFRQPYIGPIKKLQLGQATIWCFSSIQEEISAKSLKTKDTTTDTVAKITLSTLNIDSLASSIQGGVNA